MMNIDEKRQKILENEWRFEKNISDISSKYGVEEKIVYISFIIQKQLEEKFLDGEEENLYILSNLITLFETLPDYNKYRFGEPEEFLIKGNGKTEILRFRCRGSLFTPSRLKKPEMGVIVCFNDSNLICFF